MAFSATLYNNSDDPRQAVKSLGTGIPIASIVPTEDCDILNPTFILDYNSSYTACNYIVVGAPFNRSYFITDEKISIGKKIVISCAVDVLSTYWADIKGNEVNVVRQENLTENNIPDPEFKLFSDFSHKNYLPDNASPANPYSGILDEGEINPYCYVLTYAGGPYTSGPQPGGGN